ALYEREMTVLEERLDELGEAIGSFEVRVRAATKVYFNFVVDRHGLLATLQMKLPERWFKPSVRERLVRLLRYWSDAVERELGVPTEEARSLARASLAATEGIAASLRSGYINRDHAAQMSAEYVLGGLRALRKAKR